ncbi:lipoprotein [Myroides sp. DW712]|uniref:lipoprotein n=1 Tax=Myroides sp. DW712 TaxID=3389800 RepID=UPI00397DD79C
MKKFIYLLSALVAVAACTVEKTDYKTETNTVAPEAKQFKEIFSSENETYILRVEALEGQLYQGYNEVRVQLLDVHNKQAIENAKVSLLPVHLSETGEETSCPHSTEWIYEPQNKYYTGYIVFTQIGEKGAWVLVVAIEDIAVQFQKMEPIEVKPQPNMNLSMTSFIGKDQEEYIIALVAPMQPKVAENELVAGIFKRNKSIGMDTEALHQAYEPVENYTLLLDPRMPEPSMGNHSSPNNRDLVQRKDGLYQGVVNYTMTGNWTLNLILQNNQGRILKGTKVPTDFTPGVAGVKSELYLDILF